MYQHNIVSFFIIYQNCHFSAKNQSKVKKRNTKKLYHIIP